MKPLVPRPRTLRHYRMVRGAWGLGFHHEPDGHIGVTVGPWVVTTQPGTLDDDARREEQKDAVLELLTTFRDEALKALGLQVARGRSGGPVIAPEPEPSTGWEPPTDPDSDPVRRTP